MKEKRGLQRAIVIGWLLALVLCSALMGIGIRNLLAPAEVITPRPAEQVIVALGTCDAVTVGNVTKVLCSDGSGWIAVQSDPTLIQEPVE